MSDLGGNPNKKSVKNQIQDILNAVYIRAANLLSTAVYGVAGSNYLAIRVKNTGAASSGAVIVSSLGAGGGEGGGGSQYAEQVAASSTNVGNMVLGVDRTNQKLVALRVGVSGRALTCVLNPGGGTAPSRVSADLLSSLIAATSAIYIRPGTGNAASGLYIRFGTNAAKISAIQLANARVSVISNRFTDDGAIGSGTIAPVFINLNHQFDGTNWVRQTGKISAIQVANHKVSNIMSLNQKVSAITLPGNLAASGIYVRTGAGLKVSAIQVANHKISAIQVANHKVSSIYNAPHLVTAVGKPGSLRASAAYNAAGTATIVAASAGFTRKLTSLMITTYASGRMGIKVGGGGKITPFWFFQKGSGISHNFGIDPAAIAGSAIKISANGGSGQVVAHYRVN